GGADGGAGARAEPAADGDPRERAGDAADVARGAGAGDGGGARRYRAGRDAGRGSDRAAAGSAAAAAGGEGAAGRRGAARRGVVAGVRGIARAEAQRCGAQLVVEAGGALPRVLGDAIQLQQVVLNLVRNAAEAMSGHVEGGAVRIRTWATGEQVMLAVEDEGPPIDEVALREMFTPFSTTKAEGLGIGLAISRAIVEAHGGRLWAERRPGAGLAVQFTLPAWVSKWTTAPPASDLQERG